MLFEIKQDNKIRQLNNNLFWVDLVNFRWSDIFIKRVLSAKCNILNKKAHDSKLGIIYLFSDLWQVIELF